MAEENSSRQRIQNSHLNVFILVRCRMNASFSSGSITVAQTFEDTGVAAYAGQASALMGSNAALTTALRIHSVKARHAAEIRIVRTVSAGRAPSTRR